MINEKLNITLGLSGTYWDRTPEFVVHVDGESKHAGKVECASNEVFKITFEVDLLEDAEHELTVTLMNKTPDDTIENEDKTAILKDMLLNIHSLEIDGIDVGELLWSNSEYFMDNGEYMAECVNLGKNGRWSFKFSCPYYIWLLENM